jgi:hypothetical protein
VHTCIHVLTTHIHTYTHIHTQHNTHTHTNPYIVVTKVRNKRKSDLCVGGHSSFKQQKANEQHLVVVSFTQESSLYVAGSKVVVKDGEQKLQDYLVTYIVKPLTENSQDLLVPLNSIHNRCVSCHAL